MYQRRNPRHRRTPSVVSLLSEGTSSTSSSNLPSTRVCVDSARAQQVLRSASASSDCVHHVDCFDLTSNDFDVNQIQPPSPPESPPPSPLVIHVDTSGAAPPQLSSSTSPLVSSSAVTTDIEVIRTETVSLHNIISNKSSTITLTLTYTDTHVHSLRLKK